MRLQIGIGMLAYMKCTSKEGTRLDLIPVDLAANAVIVAGWDLVTNK